MTDMQTHHDARGGVRYAELCAGYGGLGVAVEQVFGAELAWYSEFDPAASKIMAHHWPDAPNHGDMTRIDWAAVEPVDILSGGTPCQDLSHAGRRQGMTEGTRSNLWVQMREAIAIIRPRFVVWENVRGAYSAGADSAVEFCPGCMGDPRDRGPSLRALGRVVGDLAELGYVGGWRGLRAADVGAPHGRHRVFVLAMDSHASRSGAGARLRPRGLPLQPRRMDWALRGWDVISNLGPYARPVVQWELALGRPVPRPVVIEGGTSKLSTHFTEWLMGLPAGWVTDIPISRNDQLKALGNGVVPQQAATALADMLAALRQEHAA